MLQVKHLSKSYSSGDQIYPVLKDVSLEVGKGEFVAVMGPSGSGKTTLLNCISRFIPHEQGEILLADNDISSLNGEELARVRNRRMGFVFQDFMLLDGLSVFENICLPQIRAHRPAAQMEEKARNIGRLFGIEKIMEKYPAEISGGEKQRTAVARALMNQPYVILADEPTGALDSKNAKALMEKLAGLNQDEHATILMVTHDSNAASYCSRILFIQDGVLFHELRRDIPDETRPLFYERILMMMAQLGGGSANVL